jgi:GxxExxY protein
MAQIKRINADLVFIERSAMELKHKELTDAIINAFYLVYNTLGYGFLERVYRNATMHELRKRGYQVESEIAVKVCYDGVIVGDYFADLIVNRLVILEIKSVESIAPAHEAQLTNYLKATGIEVGLVLNFGPKPQFRRRVFETARKKP